MMEHYSTEMKKRNEFFSKHRYKNIGKIRQKFLKVKMGKNIREMMMGN